MFLAAFQLLVGNLQREKLCVFIVTFITSRAPPCGNSTIANVTAPRKEDMGHYVGDKFKVLAATYAYASQNRRYLALSGERRCASD